MYEIRISAVSFLFYIVLNSRWKVRGIMPALVYVPFMVYVLPELVCPYANTHA